MTAATIPPPPTDHIQPGVYDIPADQYHADPVAGGSLSSSGARKLLPPSCPALFLHDLTHPSKPRPDFDLGHAAHRLVLGAGPEIVAVDFDSWRTNDAKAQAAEARTEGKVPLLRADYTVVQDMAAALRAHPVASALFHPQRGQPEQSLFWIDRRSGVWLRARLDWLPNPGPGRMVVPDYKTCRSAAPDHIQKDINSFGYHQQADWYLTGVQALGLAGRDAAFVFVFQEKTPPYLVTVAQPDPTAMRIGGLLNREAIELYSECRRTNRWPGYSDDISLISLPPWVENQYAKELSW